MSAVFSNQVNFGERINSTYVISHYAVLTTTLNNGKSNDTYISNHFLIVDTRRNTFLVPFILELFTARNSKDFARYIQRRYEHWT